MSMKMRNGLPSWLSISFAIVISGIWTGIVLWEFSQLKQWMNDSGLLDNKETMSLSSFGAFVPFFMMIGRFFFFLQMQWTVSCLSKITEKTRLIRRFRITDEAKR